MVSGGFFVYLAVTGVCFKTFVIGILFKMSLVTCCCVASENGGNSDPKVSDNFYYYLDDCFSRINMDDMKPGLDIILNTDDTLFQNIHI